MLVPTLITKAAVVKRAPCMGRGFVPASLVKATHFINVNNTLNTLNTSLSTNSSGPTTLNLFHEDSISLSFDILARRRGPRLGTSVARVSFSRVKFMFDLPVRNGTIGFIGVKMGCRGQTGFGGSFVTSRNGLKNLSRARRVTSLLGGARCSAPLTSLVCGKYLIGPVTCRHSGGKRIVLSGSGGPVVMGKCSNLLTARGGCSHAARNNVTKCSFGISAGVGSHLCLNFALNVGSISCCDCDACERFGRDSRCCSLCGDRDIGNCKIGMGLNTVFHPVRSSPFEINLTIRAPAFCRLGSGITCDVSSPVCRSRGCRLRCSPGGFITIGPSTSLTALRVGVAAP